MVSGFFTSPCDHSRIFSGLASEIRIAEKLSGSLGFSKKEKISRISAFSRSVFRSGDDAAVLGRFDELYVETQRLELFDEHVERFGQTRFERVVTLHDGLVHASPALHVVALDGEELLQRVGRAVGFHGPHFHFAETLAAELRFTAEGLLRDEGVRTDRTSVDFVVHQVVELQDVHDADRHVLLERLTRAAVEQDRLSAGRTIGELERALDRKLLGAVEHRRAEEQAALELGREAHDVRVVHALHELLEVLVGFVGFDDALADLVGAPPGFESARELAAELASTPTEVRLEDLTDVHAARNAERVQHDVHRSAVFEVRHVLLRQDPAHDTLVAVTTGHLVADLELATDGDVDLHHLDHAGRELVAPAQALDLVAEVLLAFAHHRLEIGEQLLHLIRAGLDRDFSPVPARDRLEFRLVELDAFVQEHLALVIDELARGLLAAEHVTELAVEGVAQDLRLLVARAFEAGALGVLDGPRALVLLRAFAREDAGVDHDAADARRHLERAVAHVAGLFAEDRAEQLLLGRELALTLRSDLADEDVARLHLGADAHDARVVEVLQGLLADVGDVFGDFFLAELRVTGNALELLDVNRGEHVVLGDALRHEDRVLEVEALPRHERHEHVLAEGEIAHVAGGTVGEHVALLHHFARPCDRLLVVTGALVRALVLREVIDVRHLVAF